MEEINLILVKIKKKLPEDSYKIAISHTILLLIHTFIRIE